MPSCILRKITQTLGSKILRNTRTATPKEGRTSQVGKRGNATTEKQINEKMTIASSHTHIYTKENNNSKCNFIEEISFSLL